MTDPEGTRLFHQTMPFSERLGIEVLSHARHLVRGRLAWAPTLCTIGDAFHGGVLMALADSTGAVCAYLNLPDGASGTATLESKTNFLRAIHSGHATASSRPLHTGRRVIVVETEIHDDDEKLIAKVTQTQAVL
ncbi:MAG TPA: PaaI family thioesterase [Amycolatopsis sp.]|nr:PaaI family thioesterase [Amycolatopsis sp.]